MGQKSLTRTNSCTCADAMTRREKKKRQRRGTESRDGIQGRDFKLGSYLLPLPDSGAGNQGRGFMTFDLIPSLPLPPVQRRFIQFLFIASFQSRPAIHPSMHPTIPIPSNKPFPSESSPYPHLPFLSFFLSFLFFGVCWVRESRSRSKLTRWMVSVVFEYRRRSEVRGSDVGVIIQVRFLFLAMLADDVLSLELYRERAVRGDVT